MGPIWKCYWRGPNQEPLYGLICDLSYTFAEFDFCFHMSLIFLYLVLFCAILLAFIVLFRFG